MADARAGSGTTLSPVPLKGSGRDEEVPADGLVQPLHGRPCSASARATQCPPGIEPTLLSARDQPPGCLCGGDVRPGPVTRVGSAVGEGAIAAEYLHRYLDLARQVREQRAQIATGDDDLVQEPGDPDRWIRSRAT